MLQAFATVTSNNDVYFETRENEVLSTDNKIRLQAIDLVSQNKLLEAMDLVALALEQNPDSQDLLAMMGLICEVRHDWHQARYFLEKLAVLQADSVTAQTLGHLVRVIRCQGLLEQALQQAEKGLQLHPADEMLQSEVETLRSMIKTEAMMRA